MFTTAIRSRIAEVLSFVIGGAGIVAILIMVLGLFIDLNADFWAAWILGTGALAGVAIVPLFWKGVDNSSDLNFWIILADLVFMIGAMASLMLTGGRWWVAFLAYAALVVAGGACTLSRIYLVQVGGAVLLLISFVLVVTALTSLWAGSGRPLWTYAIVGGAAGLYAAASIHRMWKAAME